MPNITPITLNYRDYQDVGHLQMEITVLVCNRKEVYIDKDAYWKVFPSGEWDLRLYCAAHGFLWYNKDGYILIRLPELKPPPG